VIVILQKALTFPNHVDNTGGRLSDTHNLKLGECSVNSSCCHLSCSAFCRKYVSLSSEIGLTGTFQPRATQSKAGRQIVQASGVAAMAGEIFSNCSGVTLTGVVHIPTADNAGLMMKAKTSRPEEIGESIFFWIKKRR